MVERSDLLPATLRLLRSTGPPPRRVGSPSDPVPPEDPARGAAGDGTGRSIAEADAVLRRRTSHRTYAPRPVHAGQVLVMLDAARRQDRVAFRPEAASGGELDLFVLAGAVTGLTSGLHRYSDDRLTPLDPVTPASAGELGFDDVAGAAAIILVFGDLVAACRQHGGHGYRLLLVRAGAAGHAAWLTGVELGLAGCLLGGLRPEVARTVCGPRTTAVRHLLSLVVGHPSGAGPGARARGGGGT